MTMGQERTRGPAAARRGKECPNAREGGTWVVAFGVGLKNGELVRGADVTATGSSAWGDGYAETVFPGLTSVGVKACSDHSLLEGLQ